MHVDVNQLGFHHSEGSHCTLDEQDARAFPLPTTQSGEGERSHLKGMEGHHLDVYERADAHPYGSLIDQLLPLGHVVSVKERNKLQTHEQLTTYSFSVISLSGSGFSILHRANIRPRLVSNMVYVSPHWKRSSLDGEFFVSERLVGLNLHVQKPIEAKQPNLDRNV